MKLSYILSISLLAPIVACGEQHSFNSTPSTQKSVQKAAEVIPDNDAEPLPIPDASTPDVSISVAPQTVTKTQEFSLIKAATPVDMLWVIDNSGSMGPKVAQVRLNFDAFLKTIADRTDVRLTLISATQASSPSLGVSLSPQIISEGHQQLGAEVFSNNLMDLAAAALCSVDSTQISSLAVILKGDRICGLQATAAFGQGLHINELRNEFKSRLREGSKRVVVFVTDDDEKGMINGNNFMSATQSDPANTTVFAFRGDRSKGSCGIPAKGLNYEALAAQTGGAVFDICDTDWSSNFASLSQAIVKLATNAFTVDSNSEVKIVKVVLGSTELTEDQYSVLKNQVTLKDETLATKEDSLIVTYEVTE